MSQLRRVCGATGNHPGAWPESRRPLLSCRVTRRTHRSPPPAPRRRCRPRGRPGRSRRTRAQRRPTRPRSESGSATFNSAPGLVCERPRGSCLPARRPAAGRWWPRSWHSSAAVCWSRSSSPSRRSSGTNTASIGARRLPAGIPSTAQQKISAAMTFGPYFGRPRLPWLDHLRAQRGATPCGRGRDASRSSRTTSSRIRLFSGLVRPPVARRHRLRHGLALTHRQSHRPGLSCDPPGRLLRHAATRTFSVEATKRAYAAHF